MEAFLGKTARDRDRPSFDEALEHKEKAVRLHVKLGQTAAADAVEKKFGLGSNATIGSYEG